LTCKIHFTGDFSPPQVVAGWGPPAPPLPAEVEAAIESAWRQALQKPGAVLFDGPLIQLQSWRIEAGRLCLVLGHTSFKRFVGTHLIPGDLAERFGPRVRANPLGLSAVLQSADDFLLMGRRNAQVACYPHRVHPFAGSATDADVFGQMRRELFEEVNLGQGDIAQMRCIGLAEDQTIHQPELIFFVRSTLRRMQITDRLDAAEHDAVWFTRADPASVRQAMQEKILTPVAAASLLLWKERAGVASSREDV
jgi:hypothetical protein